MPTRFSRSMAGKSVAIASRRSDRSFGIFFGRFISRGRIAAKRAGLKPRPNGKEGRNNTGLEDPPLQNYGGFLKIQPRIARVELVWVPIAEIAEKVDLPFAIP